MLEESQQSRLRPQYRAIPRMIPLKTLKAAPESDLRRLHYDPIPKKGRFRYRNARIPAHLWLRIGEGFCEIQQI
jgi:hypothetical protein